MYGTDSLSLGLLLTEGKTNFTFSAFHLINHFFYDPGKVNESFSVKSFLKD